MSKVFTFKFLLILLTSLFFVGVLLSRQAQAQESSQSNQFSKTQEKKIENFAYLNLKYTAKGLLKLLAGDPEKGEIGAAGGLFALAGGMYQYQPASGVGYMADIAGNLGFAKRAYAQDCPDGDCEGFQALHPVQTLWVISRNLVYLAYIVIFVIIGLMIVLRARIDPRTTASVQAAIPGVIISLLLVTFSYAIAGLIIDLMRLITVLIAQIFNSADISDQLQGLIVNIQTQPNFSIFDLVLSLFTDSKDSVKAIFVALVEAASGIFPGGEIFQLFSVTEPGSNLVGLVLGLIIMTLIILIAFRIFLVLLTAFVTLLLLTIVSPFFFLLAALPGRSPLIIGWLRSMLVNAMTFPVTFLFLALAAMFMQAGGDKWNIWINQPPISNIEFVPVPLGQLFLGTTNIMNDLIGIGILLMLPRVNELISGALPAGQIGKAVGGDIRGNIAALTRVLPF